MQNAPEIKTLIRKLISERKHEDVRSLAFHSDQISDGEGWEICLEVGREYVKQYRSDIALDYLEKALQFNGVDAGLHYYLGICYKDLNFNNKSEAAFLEALRLDPSHPGAANNLSLAHIASGDFDSAEQLLTDILKRDPENIPGVYNLAFIRDRQCAYLEAISLYDRVLSIDPRHEGARFNKSMIELLIRRYREGFKNFRFRPSAVYDPRIPNAVHFKPKISDKKILLLNEMGIGEELFFLKFLPLLEERGCEYFYVASPKIAKLLRRHGFSYVGVLEPKRSDYDHVLSIIDLPFFLGLTDPLSIPKGLKLKPSADATLRARAVLSEIGNGAFIGITWRAGNQNQRAGKPWILLDKEVSRKQLVNCIAKIGIPIPVQRGITQEEMDSFPSSYGGYFNFVNQAYDDLDLMLGLMDCLDEYVCVSNSHFYLRESIGLNSHVLVTYPPDWRWNDSGKSDWFPETPIFRLPIGNGLETIAVKLDASLRLAISNSL